MKQYQMPDSQLKVVNRNANLAVIAEGKLEDAYKQIESSLGIPVLVLEELPENMRFKRLFLDEEHAILEFTYYGKSIYFEEAKMLNTSGKSRMLVSDRKPAQEIYNFWLDQVLQVEANELEDGITEYSVRIESDASYYYLSGIMPKTIFLDLVEQINIY